jgi:hypothetical protein
MPKMLIYGKGLVITATRPFPQSSGPLHASRPSMTHPVHATGPNKRACTALIKLSAHCALQFSSYSWRGGTRQRPKTIVNTF